VELVSKAEKEEGKMKPACGVSRIEGGARDTFGRCQCIQSRGCCINHNSSLILLAALFLICCSFLIVPVAAEDAGVNSSATLRISASIAEGIGLDVDPVEGENVTVQEETYVEGGVTKIKTVVSLGDTVVEPPEITSSTQKESDLKVTVSSNFDTSWELKVSSTNDGFMVSKADPSVRMKNPFYFLQEKSDPRFTYVQNDLALLLNSTKMKLIQGNSSVTDVPLDFGTRQEVTWDDMLQANRYVITLSFDVGAL